MKLLSIKRTDVSVHESEPETRVILVFTDDRKKDEGGHFMEKVSAYSQEQILIQAASLLIVTAGWKTMESAPKDGIRVLVVYKSGADKYRVIIARHLTSGWSTEDRSHWETDCGDWEEPLLWMPLPEYVKA